jgi:integrase
MATVYILKHKTQKGYSHTIKYYDSLSKKKKYYKTFKKLRDAQQSANELRTALDSGKRPEKKKTKLAPLTFNQVSASLRDEWAKRLRINNLAKKTHDEYGYRLNVLEREFGKTLLCKITKQQIIKYLGGVAQTFSNVTYNRSLSVIKKIFKHGLDINAVFSDPTEDIKLLSEKQHERNNFLLPAQVADLISATQKTRAKFYMPAIIFLGAEHGASKQEILSLRWPKIDFEWDEKGIIRLFRTKNKKERTEFLMPRTKLALLDWKNHLEYKRRRIKVRELKSDYVFCRIDGTPIKNFNKAWWNILKIAEIKDFHFHDLRHTFCSNLLIAGGNLKDAKEMIGHSNISMTDRYSHLTALHKSERQNLLALHYENKK